MSEADQAALKKAVAEYLDSRSANADMPESHMAAAGLALSMRRWEAAEAAFKQAAAMDPQLDAAWLMLGRLRAALGDEQGAEQYLQNGLQYQPRSFALMFERADLESRRGNDSKAIDWYRRIVAIDETRADAWLQLASAALRTRNAALALDATDKVIALEPANADAFVIAAIAHYLRGDMGLAKEKAVKARELVPAIQLPVEIEKILTDK
jgi:tetratricopeptide (TPR) repeat protein